MFYHGRFFMNRVILHSDLNNFYASIECVRDPSLRSLPVAVCGDPDLRLGIILAKNQIAKSRGVSTGEAIWQAKQKCPNLRLVKANYDSYLDYSRAAKKIYGRFTDQIEPFGIDECWLDVTGSSALFGTGQKIADEIRDSIRKEMGITASIGVSFNKIFAKLGSDLRKPDYTTVIEKNNFRSVIWRLPASDLLYVGRSSEAKLKKIGIKTIGDIAAADAEVLCSQLGKWGEVLKKFASGEDSSPVSYTGETSVIKSIGNSGTLPRDVSDPEDIKSAFYMLADSVSARLRESELKCRTVQIYVRDSDMFSYERQGQLKYPSFISKEIADKAMEIYAQKGVSLKPIRTLGVRGANLVSKNACLQLDLFTNFIKRERTEAAEHCVDEIRNRFGYHSVKRGILFVDRKLTGINAKDEHVFTPVGYF